MIWIWIAAYVIIGILFSANTMKGVKEKLNGDPISDREIGFIVWLNLLFWPLLIVYVLVILVVERIAGIK